MSRVGVRIPRNGRRPRFPPCWVLLVDITRQCRASSNKHNNHNYNNPLQDDNHSTHRTQWFQTKIIMPRFVGAFAPRRRRTGTPRIRWLILFLTVCVAIGGFVRWEYLR